MIENAYLFILLLLGVTFICLIVNYFSSNKKGRKVFRQRVVTKESKTYLIKVNYSTQVLTFCTRGLDKDTDETIISFDIKIHDFIESLPLQQQHTFYDFIFSDCLKENTKTKIVVNANKILKLEDHHWLRLNFKEKTAPNIVYIKGVQIYKRNPVKAKKEFEHLSVTSFRKRIEELHKNIEEPTGTLYCFICNKMDIISKRYGVEIANDYMMYMWDEINNIFANKGFVGHLKGDIFFAYYDGLINKRDIQNMLNYISDQVDFNFEIDTYTFEIKPFIGAIVVGEFGGNIEKTIDSIYQTTVKLKEEALGRRTKIYDVSLYNEFKREEEYYEDLKNIMENSLFDPLYSPVISLYDGKLYGYFSDMDFSKYSFSSFNDAMDKANFNELGADFFSKALTKWFTSFLEKADNNNQKLFIYTNFELIDNLITTYTSNPDYKKINLVVVITNYDDMLKDPLTTKQKIQQLRRLDVTLGLIASLRLQTVLSQELRYFSYLILPRDLTSNIVKDQRKLLVLSSVIDITQSFYMQKIAIDIDNYEEAEVLKDQDVLYMSGNLFDPKKSTKSIRTLAHLYDDNNYHN